VVEFALVFPIFALMLFGMVQFGLVFNCLDIAAQFSRDRGAPGL